MMKKLSIIQILLASFLAIQAFAGTLTIVGSQTVSTNLTAQSITLGGQTLSNWPIGFRMGIVLTNGTLDTSLSQYYAITMTNHVTWSFQGHSIGRVFWLKTLQGSTGGWSNVWDTSILWPSGMVPATTTSSNRWDLFHFVDDGANWLGTVDGNNYATDFAYALQFDGSQNYVDAGNSSAFYPTNSLTVECWFKYPSTPNNAVLVSSHDDTESATGYWIVIDNDKIYGSVYSNGTYFGAIESSTVGGGAWHHAALTWDGANYTLWVDGASAGSMTVGGPLANIAPLRIGGGDPDGEFNTVNGIIDEVRISKIVRYTTSFSPSSGWIVDNDTVAYWKFNQGTGTTAIDETGNHNATLQGSPTPAWVEGK